MQRKARKGQKSECCLPIRCQQSLTLPEEVPHRARCPFGAIIAIIVTREIAFPCDYVAINEERKGRLVASPEKKQRSVSLQYC